ncbi:hypothetical protein ZYGR_0H01280 [Zygosaccharomyces rouxii]|uniref:ZYRO0B06930p n=2 Tax=Zygosaccharomyces rouxii TaxID=4956 RepID=C5DRA8_ZYGRC|nr:uncharacterized protein ZYRO0B06930g [Zygosaccharomyces rouxii]GAV47287.1 hypothetical protein ZYGR_0H01280 [Zygosaccharomyces rouxii]CAR26319.1 ZYRO0B06930p [Zygosaccharomyces rouxii]
MVVKLREIKSNGSIRNIHNSMQLDDVDADVRRQRDESEELLRKKRKPRAKKVNKLSKEEVRQNHVSSEKKRRELVRTIYDELVKMIPDLQPTENRSEMVIYLKTINHLNWLYRNNKRLCAQLEKKYKELGKDGCRIPESLVWELRQGGDSGGNSNDEGNHDNEDIGDNSDDYSNASTNTNNNSKTNSNTNSNTDSNINFNTDTDNSNNNNGTKL